MNKTFVLIFLMKCNLFIYLIKCILGRQGRGDVVHECPTWETVEVNK